MFRNPEAHELKTEWIIEEQDALDILSMISYCHRRLDKAQKINIWHQTTNNAKLSHSEGFFYALFPNMRKLTEEAD